MIADLTKEEKTENLEDKRRLLELLRKRMDFADIQKAYDNWRFSDLVGDSDFKRMYEDQAVKEREKPDSEYFEENIGKYIKLVEEGKEITSRYFGKWKVNFQAYCEEINNRVLNVNLIHYDKSEPTRISDILQQEKDIKELNIYCNKKHEIYAHRKGKKRHYKFKEGAYYKMTSTWPVKDGSEMCTIIMNVSSDGITEVLKFNGKDFVPSEEILELIKQNDELYIQDLFLYDAVMKSLEKGKAADVVPTANNNFQNESIAAYQDKEPGGNRKVQTLKLMMTIAFILLLLLIAMHQLKQKLIYNRLQLRQKLIHNKPKLKRKSIYNRLQLRQKLLHNILESKQKLTHNK